MKVRMRLAIPLLLACLAGCTVDQPSTQYTSTTTPASVAPPQQVNAASDALGQRLDNKYSVTNGASVVLDTPTATAGDYYVKVTPFSPSVELAGNVAAVPKYFTDAYTLKVSNK
jgi:hypothetical protein